MRERAVWRATRPGRLEGSGVAVRGLRAHGRREVPALRLGVRLVAGREPPSTVGCGGASGIGDPTWRHRGAASGEEVVTYRVGFWSGSEMLLPGTFGGRVVPLWGAGSGGRIDGLVFGALGRRTGLRSLMGFVGVQLILRAGGAAGSA